jgi:CheY-like chemotaxis protein
LLVQSSRDDGLEMYAESLRYHGLTPIAVSTGNDALTLAPNADIIVTGIVLPGSMDGVELTARLRGADRTKHTPIIFLTACAFQSDRERARRAGCDVFLTKPCLPNELLCEVRRLLAASKPRHHKLITTIRRFSRKAVRRAGNPAAVPRAGNRTPHCGPTALFTLADMARRMVRA